MRIFFVFLLAFLFSNEIVRAATGDTVKCDFSFFIPKAISFSREENARPAIFIPRFDSIRPDSFSFEVYDRWGIRMFATKNIAQGWNGRKNNREAILHDGKYYWVMCYKMKNESVTRGCADVVQCSGMEYLAPISMQDTVQCDRMYLSNSFTAGDDHINDEFKPVFVCPPAYYEMWIYDRWGYMIYYTNDAAKGWDGTIKRVTDQPIIAQPGVYVYKIKCSLFYSDIKHVYTGQVTLLR